MNDERTPHLNLPLPHPANSLEEDVYRLREALTRMDQLLVTGEQDTTSLATPHVMAIVLGG